MRYTIWDSHALEIYDRAGLTHLQRAVIEGLLRSLEAGTYLSEHVASASSVVLALTRAHHALDGHLRADQPQIGLTRTVLSQALREVRSGTSAFACTPSASVVVAQTEQALAQANAAISRGSVSTSTQKQQLVTDLGDLVEPAMGAVRVVFETLWDGLIALPAEVANRIRDEVAVLVTLKGRDGLALKVDLLRLFSTGVISAAAVADVLWPPHKQYRIALVVSGTRVLEGLERLLPGARQWPLIGPNPPAGIPYFEVRKLVNPVLASVGSSTLVILPVAASDVWTAIAQGRRDVVETLDQYAAGQRLLELTLEPRSVAMTPKNEPFTSDPRMGGISKARPLTGYWPTPVRSALRMANLASRMDAPVASVMLSWSAIESMRIKGGDIELVAKACALHSVRQQILSAYKSVTDSANARLRFFRSRVIRGKVVLNKAERGHAATARIDSLRAQEAAVRLEMSIRQVRTQLMEAESSYAQIEERVLPSIEIIRRNLLNGGDKGHPLNMSSWLLDINKFLDAILPLTATASADVRDTANALAMLAQEADGLASEHMATWQRRLANPSEFVDWLNGQQITFHGLLSWMYASRNEAIHEGQFSVPADLLTAEAARGIVDMVLEFLGHWYQEEHIRGLRESAARDVVVQLANRKDVLEGYLRTSASCHPLNVASITAIDSDCWNRK